MALLLALKATRRNRVSCGVVAVQVACSMAVLVNAWVLVGDRVEALRRESGVAEADLFHVGSFGFAKEFNGRLQLDEDLRLLRGMPDVVDASTTNSVPLSNRGSATSLAVAPGSEVPTERVAYYLVDDHGPHTLGVRLVAGSGFVPKDVVRVASETERWPDKVLLSAATASGLWPGEEVTDVVGRTVYIEGTHPMAVVGVVATLQGPWSTDDELDKTMLLPMQVGGRSARYLIRTAPGTQSRVVMAVQAALAEANRGRVVSSAVTMAETRTRAYRIDVGVAVALAVVSFALMGMAMLGVAGNASYVVNRRRSEIGTRRALGATRIDVLSYFLMENWVYTSIGAAVGALLTVLINVWLVFDFAFPKVTATPIVVGVGLMWMAGLFGALVPAGRAMGMAPAAVLSEH